MVLRQLSVRGWLTLLACLSLVAVCTLGLGRFATSSRYTTLPAADVDKQQEIAGVLDRHGIRWRLDANGSRLAVEAHRREEAERVLVDEGLRPAPRGRRPEPPADAVSAEFERGLNQLIADTVGRDRAFVSAKVSVDRDRVASRSLRYGRRGVALASGTEVERFRSETARRDRAWRATSWATDQTLTDVRFARGRTERVALALVVDRRVHVREARQLRRAIATAAGINRARGDRIELSRLKMSARPDKPAASAGWWVSPEARLAVRAAPWAILGLAMAIFFLEIGRALRTAKRLRHAPDEPLYVSAAPLASQR